MKHVSLMLTVLIVASSAFAADQDDVVKLQKRIYDLEQKVRDLEKQVSDRDKHIEELEKEIKQLREKPSEGERDGGAESRQTRWDVPMKSSCTRFGSLVAERQAKDGVVCRSTWSNHAFCKAPEPIKLGPGKYRLLFHVKKEKDENDGQLDVGISLQSKRRPYPVLLMEQVLARSVPDEKYRLLAFSFELEKDESIHIYFTRRGKAVYRVANISVRKTR